MQIDRMSRQKQSWEPQFKEIFDRGVERYTSGNRSVTSFFSSEEISFLASIGCKEQELFDFVEDRCNYGEPDFETALQVAVIRERYFREVQKGVAAEMAIPASELPLKPQAMDGIPWLPRIIAKARAKLRGQLDRETMYGCGGDRPFLASYQLTLPEFLDIVWEYGDDDQKILKALRAGGK
ncbi:MAG: DUF5069 domain-containing protein [Verrucomicrobia bacterium]|nr:DUF5069 domain-containing protein [Verrucomicrobiota bacterium]